MATILVVDDRPINREFFATLLGYRGHQVLEAQDGAEALESIKTNRPHLIISDILMPTMDGYEFVRQLRADPDTANIPVIFSTAHYLDREARSLAEACGVTHTILKPSEPEEVLRLVDEALGISEPPGQVPAEEFDREHLRLLTDKLAQKTQELTRVNERLTALIELGHQLAAERDPLFLLESFCHSARRIVGAKYAAILVLDDDRETVRHFYTSGAQHDTASMIGAPPAGRGLFRKLLKEGGLIRVSDVTQDPRSEGFPENHPHMSSFLGAAIASSNGIFGALYLTDKIGAVEFSEADERLIAMLVAQVGIAYENAKRFEELQRRATELQETVSQLKRAEELARESEDRLRLAQQVARVGTFDWNFQTGVNRWTPELEAMYGLPPGGFEGTQRSWESLIHPDDRAEAIHRVELALQGEPFEAEWRVTWPDGSVHWLAGRAWVFRDETGKPLRLVGVNIDITERKHVEEALREANQTLQSLVQTSPLAIIALDLDGVVKSWNAAAEGIFGWSEAEVIGLRIQIIPDQEWDDFYNSLDITRKAGAFTGFETTRLRKDGSSIDVSVSAAPLADGRGVINGSVLVIADITERKHLEQQFRQAQKLEAVGRLAGGVAHDFNNLLTAIIGYSQLALGRLHREDPMRKEIEEIERAGQRAAGLTNQLLAFSRRQVLQPQVLNLNDVVENLARMLERLIGEDVVLNTSLAPDIGPVKADRGQIEQIIMNLAVNSRDAMPEGGNLTIETFNADLDESYTSEHIDVQPGPHVVLAISDNGCGMDKETQSNVFEPFFTTKEQGKGTGLGLSTVYGIVNQSGGHIALYTELGMGTTFKIYLPRLEETDTTSELRVSQRESLEGSETVLLVEDEASVRKLARDILEMHGYVVLEASGSDEVLEICERHEGHIHLMLTDVVMPGANGRELAQLVTPLQPKMSVLYMSGYTEDAITQHGVLGADTPFLQKPFSPQALARKVREVLDRST